MSAAEDRRVQKRVERFREEAANEFWDLSISDDGAVWEGTVKLQMQHNDSVPVVITLDDKFPFSSPTIEFAAGQLQHELVDPSGLVCNLWQDSWSPACQRLSTIMWTLVAALNEKQQPLVYSSDDDEAVEDYNS